MNNPETVIILGTAHRKREPGKQSPDGRLKEYIYSREIVGEVKAKLEAYGYRVFVDFDKDDMPKEMQTPSSKLERQRELAMRVNYVNEMCQKYGKAKCIYVSIHVNAVGSDGKWHDARGLYQSRQDESRRPGHLHMERCRQEPPPLQPSRHPCRLVGR